MKTIRTRFAPSPTGFMHVGGVRTALFAWLLAVQNDGVFILRIEDTDKKRQEEGSIEHIMESLRWLGIEWGEGPDVSGDHGPYLQSERLDRYKKLVEKLLSEDKAYVDTSTPEQVNAWRKEAQANKQPFLFRNHRDKAKSTEDWDGDKPVRLEIKELRRVEWHDIVRGDLSAGEEALDDFVIMKADGFPTYNFAHVVDDHDMEISHVIRGEEFIASTPKFIVLHEALGYDLPQFATAPPILNQNGGKKLSKRDGAKDVLEYRDEGYTVSGVANFLASMGWNDGTEQEVFTVAELINSFSLERVQKSGAKFDDERLDWLNGHHIRNMSTDDLYSGINAKFWPESAKTFDDDYKKAVLSLIKERLKFYKEIPNLSSFFFEEPNQNIELLVNSKIDQPTATKFLQTIHNTLASNDFTDESLEQTLREQVETLETRPGILFKLIRSAVTGSQFAPGLFETMRVLGRERSLQRIQAAIYSLG